MSLRNLKLQITNFKLRSSECRSWMQDTGHRILGKKRFYLLTTLFYILFFPSIRAQEIKVKAKFDGDSVKIGKPVEFFLTAHYPEKLNLLFPDSTFSFAPFELQKKIYFPTKTENG